VTARVVAWSTRHPSIVLGAAVAIAIAGGLARKALPRDVIPDLSDPQIVLVADWMGHPATEVASDVTQVLTRALDGVPGSTAVRGSSMSGMAYIDVAFASGADLAAGREAIVERVAGARARLPRTARVQVGPLASSTGWVFEYVLVDPGRRASLLTLRHFQDDVLRPALAAIPGVAEVASVGAGVQEVLVEAHPAALRERGLAFTDLLAALRPALSAPGAPGVADLEALPVPVPAPGEAAAAATSPRARVADVARVRIADDMPTGVADFGGGLPAVGGIVIARRDAALPALIARVKRTLEGARAELPPEVKVVTVYNRLDVANRVGNTLHRAVAEEVLVVALVVLLFLGHLRSALVPLATLPLVLLITFAAMWVLDVPATVMSLGGIAIALGMAVDADVVALEACHRRLETGTGGGDRRRRLIAAAGSFAPAILTSLMITALSFLPVFAFGGETGRLLRPMALTKTLVIAAAALVTLTAAPALRERLVRGKIQPELENRLTRWLVRWYRPFVDFALRRPVLTIATALLAVISCLPIVNRLGGEFLPRVDEGDLLFMPTTLPGVPPDQAATLMRRQDRAIGQFPEVAAVFGKVGRADTATDPAPYWMAETTVRLLPRSQWPKLARTRWYSRWAPRPLRAVLGLFWSEESPATTAELIASLDRATRLPGWSNAWTAPARARIDMMATGVRTPVGIRLVAADPDRLDALGAALRDLAAGVPGTRSAVYESLGGETGLRFVPDAQAMAQAGADPAQVAAAADFLITGGHLGDLMVDGRRLRLRVAPDMTESMRGPADQLRSATVRAGSGKNGAADAPIALGLLGRPQVVTRPAALRSERGELCAYVYVDLQDGTDVLGYVERARGELDRALAAGTLVLAPGERVEWTGQYQLLAAGAKRLRWIVPLVVASMLALLLLQFRTIASALIVLVSVPFALVGSFWTLYLLGYPMSAPVWVGLLSVVGLAMQTGVVMVVYIDDAFHRRVRAGLIASRDDIVAAHAEGTVRRLRPKVMTITTMAAALLPLLWTEGAGAEIMKRVAAPMIGGLATSAFLTLEVLPVLYTIWRHRQLRRAQRLGVPVAVVVGVAPGWARPSETECGVDQPMVPTTAAMMRSP
jgi:copper/silver efflux system protein